MGSFYTVTDEKTGAVSVGVAKEGASQKEAKQAEGNAPSTGEGAAGASAGAAAALRETLAAKTVAELAELARDGGVEGYSTMKKAELVEAVAANLEKA